MGDALRVLDAARSVRDQVNELLDRPGRRLLYDRQLRLSAASIAANIREGCGRRAGPDRIQFFRIARGSAEETDEHLLANYRRKRLSAAEFWRLHNRLAAVVKMLNQLVGE